MTSLFTGLDINTIVLAVVAVLLGLNQLRLGTSKISGETIEAYKNQVELQDKRLNDQTSTINTLTGQIGELKGMIMAKDKQIDEMRKILENRNPELDIILQKLTHFMESVDKRLTEHTEQLVVMRTHQLKPIQIATETTVTKQ